MTKISCSETNENVLRLSHFVIVNSILKESSIDPRIKALLPLSLNSIYQKFVSSRKYTENCQRKDEFYYGVGLLGVGVEDRILKRRKVMEESIRSRGSVKQRCQFDCVKYSRRMKKVKVKYNLFTIGKIISERNYRRPTRKGVKKRSVLGKRTVGVKLEERKKLESESAESSGVEEQSIALSRTKRLTKVPQLDFKYCYNESGGSGMSQRAKRSTETKKEEQVVEIVDDSDSDSVVEVSPPTIDKENNARKICHPPPNKALNLLDKLRLGLQCTVIQTEHDIILEHLTVEDLSTLRRRLQGLATFKNIEAEYGKNGQETARATIDRRLLNMPFKLGEYDSELRRSIGESRRVNDESRQTTSELRRTICESRRVSDESRLECSESTRVSTKSLKRTLDMKKLSENFSWMRPKARAVKKIRKLYTQAASTPNILARPPAMTPTRSETTIRVSSQCQSSSNESTASVSFYPQISTIVTDPVMVISDHGTEQIEPQGMSNEPITVASQCALVTATITSVSGSASYTTATSNGTPATAMSASQLLMRKKGVSNHSINDSHTPGTSSLTFSHNDQFVTNHILKPFKKTLTTSSPSKLEIDDEETEFELTPSLIEQSKPIDSSLHFPCTSSTVYVPTKLSFASKPLIQPTGKIVNSSSRTLHVANTSSFFHAHTARPLSNCRLLSCTKVPMTNPSSPLSQPGEITQTSSNLKIKHRKWTHNFLTSNSINFREVLCCPAPKLSSLPALPAALLPATSVTNVMQPVTAVQCTSNDMKALSVPVKGSNVVLKSLLVGSNSVNDLSHSQHNKATEWASKYLTTNSTGQDNSKIKWQVGGQPVFVVDTVAKHHKSVDTNEIK